MSQKTNINNLNIVWQGQSWSVIAPNGEVIGRFKEKNDAVRFAEITKTYVEKTPPQYSYTERKSSQQAEKPKNKSKFSSFDGELGDDDEEDSFWGSNNAVVEKKKIIPRTIFDRLVEQKRYFYFAIAGIVGLVAVLILLGQVNRIASTLFSTPSIFLHPDIILILGIASVATPIVLLICISIFPQALRMLLSIPITLAGLAGLIVGVLAGLLYIILSLFSPEYNTGKMLITFALWLWVSLCLSALGIKMFNEF